MRYWVVDAIGYDQRSSIGVELAANNSVMMIETNDIKNNANLIPFLGAYFILYGSISLITFYKEFNVPIIQFITFSEIIFYFIEDIYIVIGHVSILIVGAIGFNYLKTKFFGKLDIQIPELLENQKEVESIISTLNLESSKEEVQKKKEEAETLKAKILQDIHKLRNHSRKINVFIIISVCLMTLFSSWMIYQFGWSSGFSFIIPGIVSIGMIYFVKDLRLLIFTYILVSLLASAYLNAISNANQVKNGKNYGMNFDIEGTFIKSDSLNFVIGKTENHLFYYESKYKRTIVYPTSKINNITIPNK